MSVRIVVSCASLGLRTEPRSPPVQVTTRTRSPSALYRAIVAAPLLDSSSGCACTAMRRIGSLTVCLLLISAGFDSRPPRGPRARSMRGRSGTMGAVTTNDDDARAALAARYGPAPDAAARRRRRAAVVVLAVLAVAAFVVLAVVSTDEPVRAEEAAFAVVDDSAVEVSFVVHMEPGTTAECTVLALNDRFAQIGVARVPVGPSEARSSSVTTRVATTEPATGARVQGCRVTP